MTAQIVAMGGGGFSMEDDHVLDDYILGLTGLDRPRVGFLATASGDATEYIEKFDSALSDRAETSALRLFSQPSHEPGAWFQAQDVIYVGGGSTANLLAVWRVHGIERLVREAYERGVILCGVSAGAICWFEAGITDSFGPLQELREGVGLLSGSFTPHYNGEADRRPMLWQAISERFPGGFAADDYAAAHFIDGSLSTAVASREGASVYRVGLENGQTFERAVPTRYLG